MNSLKNICLAVDFSEHSSLTLQKAIELAKQFQSTLSLIHVITDYKADHESTRSQLEKKLEEVTQTLLKHHINVPHIAMEEGNIEDNTIAFAQKVKASCILVGAGNAHRGNHYRLGGHAEAILRNSSLPVMIVKNAHEVVKGKIACPVDLSEFSSESLKEAIRIAKDTKQELVAIHAIEPNLYGYPGAGFDYAYAERNFFDEEKQAFDQFLKGVDFQGITWTKKVLVGSAAYEIPAFMKKGDFSLVVLGSASRKGLSRLILGSVAEAISKSVDASCLIFKHK